jgi:DNA polymerase-3 subunit gamma/tau
LHVSLYRKYRPQQFKEVMGQDAVTSLLRSSFLEGRLGHAYLFSGPRGCGKTTAARLLAKAVNCASPSSDGEPCERCESCLAVTSGGHMDVMEIDGASNRGIDQIRELKSHVGLASFMGGMKVYILDEVHMLTAEAFNALLKTLEEPPPSVMFIFATTEPHKVPVTIRSRCQHIPFHRIPSELIVSRLSEIARREGVPAEAPALWEIARSADGALRDAISLLEQAIALGHGRLTSDSVRTLFGGGSRAEMERWVTEIRENPDGASSRLKSTLDLGVSPERFLDGLFPLLRDMWAWGLWGEKSFDGAFLSGEEKDFLRHEAPNWDPGVLRRCAMACAALYPRVRLGLRNDIFSGLLLFEMLGAIEPDAAGSPAPDVPAVPVFAASRPQARDLPPVLQARPAAAKRPEENSESVFAPVLRETKSPVQEHHTQISAGGYLPEPVLFLMKEDLPLAAALINARVHRAGDFFDFDRSETFPAALAALSGPRARAALARAFGFESEDVPVPREPAQAPAASPQRQAFRPMSSVEAISARIGADILLAKRLDSSEDSSEEPIITDIGAGEIEDE